MDWLRSEDLKEEKNVTAPKRYYSSPCTLSLPSGGVPCMQWPQNFDPVLSDHSVAADILFEKSQTTKKRKKRNMTERRR